MTQNKILNKADIELYEGWIAQKPSETLAIALKYSLASQEELWKLLDKFDFKRRAIAGEETSCVYCSNWGTCDPGCPYALLEEARKQAGREPEPEDDRELDKQMAKFVGWGWGDESAWSPTGTKWSRLDGHTWDWLPYYSQDLSQAQEVVYRLMAEGHVVIIKGDGQRKEPNNPKWTVLLDSSERTDANTPAMAICLAALKVVQRRAGRY